RFRAQIVPESTHIAEMVPAKTASQFRGASHHRHRLSRRSFRGREAQRQATERITKETTAQHISTPRLGIWRLAIYGITPMFNLAVFMLLFQSAVSCLILPIRRYVGWASGACRWPFRFTNVPCHSTF